MVHSSQYTATYFFLSKWWGQKIIDDNYNNETDFGNLEWIIYQFIPSGHYHEVKLMRSFC